MDRDIEKLLFTCEMCQINQAMPQKAAAHNWERTINLCVRLHIDYVGPFQEKLFLIIVDSLFKMV